MKNLTQQQIMHIVLNSVIMRMEYETEIAKANVKYSKTGCKIGSKKVGINKFILFQKRIAQSVYFNYLNPKQNANNLQKQFKFSLC